MQTSFEALQDFVQLPLVFIWQQQLRKVIHQALAQELSSLPHTLLAETKHQGVLRQASQHSTDTTTHQPQSAQGPLHKQAVLPRLARNHDSVSVSAATTTGLPGMVYAQTDTQPAFAEGLSASAQTGLIEDAPEPPLLSQQQPAHTAAAQGLLHGTQEDEQMDLAALASLPVAALARPSSGQIPLPTPAGRGALPEQATQRGLPNQATPVQPTFLRMCLAEVLRLTNPAQSQFQPLFCGWYTSGLTLPACHSQQQHIYIMI